MRTSLFGLAIGCLLAVSSVLLAQKVVPAQKIEPAQKVEPVQKIGEKPVAPKVESAPATHKQVKEISIPRQGTSSLQTLCCDAEGRVLGLVAPPRSFGAPIKGATSEVHVVTADGTTMQTWKVDFHAHSLNVGPDGMVFVAGDGKVAKFDRAGKQIAKVDLPHIAELLKDDGALRKKAEEQLKQQKDSFQSIVKQMKDRKAMLEEKIKAKKEEELTPQEKQQRERDKKQLQQYEQILQSYAQTQKYYDDMTVDSILAQITGRLRVINGVAVSQKDLFIVCGESKGYGYAVWRMDHDFKNAKEVVGGIGGCCGQMDIQVTGSDFLLAENTKHRFARYDRDGKNLGGWGERGRESDGKCFGGCCNPMNLHCCGADVLTAESEGIIKRFNAKGEFVSLVGVAKLAGGCKNVAVAASKDAEHVFLCDQPGSRIIVLAKNK